jgi:hypothetical protein
MYGVRSRGLRRRSKTAVALAVAGSVLFGVAEAAASGGWLVQATPNPLDATSSFLIGVSCPTRHACVAVGTYRNAADVNLPLAESWNGKKWSLLAPQMPPGGMSVTLGAISCTAATSCLAVGDYTNLANKTVALSERWNGTQWKLLSTPNPSGAVASVLNGVSCAKATACTAVGYRTNAADVDSALAERWNGQKWKIEHTPDPKGATSRRLYGVSCVTADRCLAVGAAAGPGKKLVALALAQRRKRWRLEVTPNPSGAKTAALTGVSCLEARSCTGFGVYRTVGGKERTLAERWNGRRWRIHRSANPAGAKFIEAGAISCGTSDSCTAVGDYAKGVASGARVLVDHWNGKTWRVEPTPKLAGAVNSGFIAISCLGTSTCMAVGAREPNMSLASTLAERHP